MVNLFKYISYMLIIIGASTSAPPAPEFEIGDKIGEVLSTDIVTYIEGVEVPSFNIAGRTAILVENLGVKELPFTVKYDDAFRTLYIYDGMGSGKDQFHFEDNESDQPVGTPMMDVLYTDIETFYAKEKLESFNIGGFTCVYATDFADLYGTYTWDEEARSVNIFRQKETLEGTVSENKVFLKLPANESVIEKDDATLRWGAPEKSYIVKNEDGTFSTVEVSDKIYIETYGEDFSGTSSLFVNRDFPIFGGLLSGKKYNYIVSGQENEKESDTLAVINIAVYDKEFNKIKDIPITNCRTSVPFDASNVSLTENDDFLVLHTARSQYKESNGMVPQTQLTVIIDKKNWIVTNPLEKFQPNHTSHALKGYVRFDGNKIMTANYSDAAPMRGAFMQEINTSGKLISSNTVFAVNGPAAANCTGAMLGGFEVSDTSYVFSVSSIDHSQALDYSDTKIEGIEDEERDVFIVTIDKNTKKAEMNCLTHYSGNKSTASVPYLIKLESGSFMVLWQKFSFENDTDNVVCYAFLDGNGNPLSVPFEANGTLSDSCQPVEINGKVIWYTNTQTNRIFYSIDSSLSEHNLQG